MVYSTRRFVVCLSVCHFVVVFFSPFSIAITSLGEERTNLSAFRTFVRFVLVWICWFPLPIGVWEGLRFVIVALPGLFSYLFLCLEEENCPIFTSLSIIPLPDKYVPQSGPTFLPLECLGVAGLAVERVGPEFCGRWGLLREGELLLIPATLRILFSIWWIWLCLTFRPERLQLLRPRRFSWLLRSLKSRRSRVSYFLLLLHCSSNWGSFQEPLLLGLKIALGNFLNLLIEF